MGFLGPIPALFEEEYRDKGFIPNRDKIGYPGVEDSLQDILAGRNGLRVVQIDVAGQELRNLEPPRPTGPDKMCTSPLIRACKPRLKPPWCRNQLLEYIFWNSSHFQRCGDRDKSENW